MTMHKMSDKVAAEIREREVKQMLRFVDSISIHDYLAITEIDPLTASAVQLETAEMELRGAGFYPGAVSQWGMRAIFPRYMRVSNDDNPLLHKERDEAISG